MSTFIRCAALALILVPAPGAAQDYGLAVTQVQAEDGYMQWKLGGGGLAVTQAQAEDGNAYAQYELGKMYDEGREVVQDYAEAVKWYRLSAEQGRASAQFALGAMYEHGRGVVQDYAEAVKWYRLAAEQSMRYAQWKLGYMYGLGYGVGQDFSTAHMWYNLAHTNGDKNALELRDMIASKMTADAITEAQQRARVSMASNYQDCD